MAKCTTNMYGNVRKEMFWKGALTPLNSLLVIIRKCKIFEEEFERKAFYFRDRVKLKKREEVAIGEIGRNRHRYTKHQIPLTNGISDAHTNDEIRNIL